MVTRPITNPARPGLQSDLLVCLTSCRSLKSAKLAAVFWLLNSFESVQSLLSRLVAVVCLAEVNLSCFDHYCCYSSQKSIGYTTLPSLRSSTLDQCFSLYPRFASYCEYNISSLFIIYSNKSNFQLSPLKRLTVVNQTAKNSSQNIWIYRTLEDTYPAPCTITHLPWTSFTILAAASMASALADSNLFLCVMAHPPSLMITSPIDFEKFSPRSTQSKAKDWRWRHFPRLSPSKRTNRKP